MSVQTDIIIVVADRQVGHMVATIRIKHRCYNEALNSQTSNYVQSYHHNYILHRLPPYHRALK